MRNVTHLALAGVALLISACGSVTQTPEATPTAALLPTPTDDPDLLRLPAPTGAFKVGRTTFNFTDTSRNEDHTPDVLNDQREVITDIWYPAQPGQLDRSGPYLPPMLATAYGLPISVNVSLPYAFQDAPLVPSETPYPLIIFNPGFSAAHTDYVFLMEDLASHGFVVASVAHPYVSSVAILSDGRQARFIGNDALSRIWIPRDMFEAELTEMWVPDTLFLLDKLAEGQGQFAGQLDLENVGFIGHSFGGTTTTQICATDARCAAAASLDGLPSDDAFQNGLPVPYLFIAAGDEDTANDLTARALLNDSETDSYLVNIAGAGHFDFGDGYFIVENLKAEDAVSFGSVGSERLYAITRAYVLAFFDQYIRGEDSPFLAGTDSEFGEVTLESHLP